MAAKPEVGCFKQVQEMAENGDELPHRYIWRDMNSNYGPVDLDVPLATEIPVIDVDRLVSSSPAMDDELVKLCSALSSWGCFQGEVPLEFFKKYDNFARAVNHGIENWFLDEVRQVAREFFHQPMAEKQKCARSGGDHEGYGNDIVLYENQPLDWNDRVYLLVSPQDQQKLQYWPQNPPSFRKVLEDYTASLGQLQEILLKSMARSLSIPEDCFLNQYGERPTIYARFNYYPPCSNPDLVVGLKPHADGSGLTFLLQDKQVQGLQLMKDNHWFSVPIIPQALVVNIGDQLEIMTNGIFKSPVHRAVASSERERNTLAMFFLPDPSKDVEPVEELVDDGRPKLFKKVKHYTETYFNYYQQGKRPIDAVRI